MRPPAVPPARALRTLGAAAVLAAGGVLTSPSPASAAACSGTSGVTVVVGSSVRCASGDPATGWSALESAGFSVTPVETQPGFVCRIDGAPQGVACRTTPPADRYWSYWHAQPGGPWQYSSVGARSFDPPPGSVEGWAFGAGEPPSSRAPAPAPAPAPPPPPAPAAPSAAPGGGSPGGASGSGSVGGSGSGGSGAATGSGAGSGARSGSASGSAAPTTRGGTGRTPAPPAAAPTTAPSTAPTSAPATAATSSAPGATAGAAPATPTTTRDDGDGPDAAAAAAGRVDASGPALSPLAGGLLVLALGAAAGTVAWRRRVRGSA